MVTLTRAPHPTLPHRLLYVMTHAMTARHFLTGQLAWRQAREF